MGRFGNQTLNYRLFYDGKHFVGEKSLSRFMIWSEWLDNHCTAETNFEYISKMTTNPIYEAQ